MVMLSLVILLNPTFATKPAAAGGEFLLGLMLGHTIDTLIINSGLATVDSSVGIMKRKASSPAIASLKAKAQAQAQIKSNKTPTPSSSRANSTAPKRQGRNTRSPSADPRAHSEQPSDEGDNDDDDEQLLGDDDFDRQDRLNQQSVQDLMLLVDSFSQDQLQRYEVYRRSQLNKNTVKKLMNQVLNQSVSQNVAVVCAGFTKVFVGEIVEKALDVQKDFGDSGPLAPEHIREAFRLYAKERNISQNGFKRRMFR